MNSTFDPEHEIDTTATEHEIDFQTAVDALEPLDEHDAADLDVGGIGTIPKNALAVFCQFLLPANGGQTRWRSAAVRLAVLCHSLGIDRVGEMSQTKLAEELGCSRALVSLLEVELRDFGGLALRGGKSDAARQAYSERASNVWRRKSALEAAGGVDGTSSHGKRADAATVPL